MSDTNQVHGQHSNAGAGPDLWADEHDGHPPQQGGAANADGLVDEFSSEPGQGRVVDAPGGFVADAEPIAEKSKPNILILVLAGVIAVTGFAGAGYIGYKKFIKPPAVIDEMGDLAQASVPQPVAQTAPVASTPPAAGVFDSAGQAPGVFGAAVQAGAAQTAAVQAGSVSVSVPAVQDSSAPPVQAGAAQIAAVQVGSVSVSAPAVQDSSAPPVQAGAAQIAAVQVGSVSVSAPAVQDSSRSPVQTGAAQTAAVQAGLGKSKGEKIIDEVETVLTPKSKAHEVKAPAKAVPTKKVRQVSEEAQAVARAKAERRKNQPQKLAKKVDSDRPRPTLPVFLQTAKVVGVFPLSGRNAQAWVRSSEGKTIPVRKGDVINGISILEVIPEKNTVKTSAGTINAHGVVL